MRRDKDEQLVARAGVVLRARQQADQRNVLQERNAGIRLRKVVGNQPGEADRLPILHRHARGDVLLRECRRGNAGGRGVDRRVDRADLL